MNYACTSTVRQNVSSKVVPYTGPDRLGDLPDVLLIKILSCLHVREVAQTCILSKRWRNLWASVPCLRFDLDEFSSQSRFINFVSSFLLSFDETSNLDLFELSCYGYNTYFDNGISEAAGIWIAQAVQHKPKKLKLEFSYCKFLTLPNSLYLCDSLEVLNICLENCDDVKLKPEVLYLPKLKSLYLYFVKISGDDMNKILNGCPMLESLYVGDCVLETEGVFFGHMKRLTLRESHFYREPDLKSVVLSSFVNVEVLKIWSTYLMDLLEEALQDLLVFHKLKILDLGTCCMNCSFGTLSSFLKRTPKLETLNLWHGYPLEVGCHCAENESQNSREKIEWYYCKCLKEVQILCNEDKERYVNMPQLVERVKQSTKGLNEVRIIVSYY